VTQRGPTVCRHDFADSPAFFMAVNGELAFRDSASATAGIRDLTHLIQRIELQWGDDLRVDPMAPNLAMMAASCRACTRRVTYSCISKPSCSLAPSFGSGRRNACFFRMCLTAKPIASNPKVKMPEVEHECRYL